MTGLTGKLYRLDDVPMGSGGEGNIYRIVGTENKVAKIYKTGTLTQELEEKLRVMICNLPSESILFQVAWFTVETIKPILPLITFSGIIFL